MKARRACGGKDIEAKHPLMIYRMTENLKELKPRRKKYLGKQAQPSLFAAYSVFFDNLSIYVEKLWLLEQQRECAFGNCCSACKVCNCKHILDLIQR